MVDRVNAALLDERGVYIGMDRLAAADLTPLHLPQITSCDLQPGEYLWIEDRRKRPDGTPINEAGGAFWPIKWLQQVAATRGKAEEGTPQFDPRNKDLNVLVEHLERKGLGGRIIVAGA